MREVHILRFVISELGLRDNQWSDNINYFLNNPQLKVMVDAHAKQVADELKRKLEQQLKEMPKIETEEEVLKYVAKREQLGVDLFNESILRYDR